MADRHRQADIVGSMPDWSYAKRPRWLLSHAFVAAMVLSFIWAGMWQLERLSERQALNEVVLSRSEAPAVTVAQALASGDLEDLKDPDGQAELNYVKIADSGSWLDPELVRVANRSLNGRAGDWQIGTFVTNDGLAILVNRGFLGRDDVSGPATDGEILGWLQTSRMQEGYFGAADSNVGERVPRLNVVLLGERAGLEVAPLWLQKSGEVDPFEFPQPVPLPGIDEGSHFSYAMQWFTFATLTTIFYGLILRKKAKEESGPRAGSPQSGSGP